MKSRVHPTYKTKYRVKNWASYDRALVRRGDVTVWFSAAAIAAWEPAGVGRRGGQLRYSDLAIETALTIRLILNLLTSKWVEVSEPAQLARCLQPICHRVTTID